MRWTQWVKLSVAGLRTWITSRLCKSRNGSCSDKLQRGRLVPVNFDLDLTGDTIIRKTLQTTEARILSGFGWGLTKRIESHGLSRFKANVQRVGIDSTPISSLFFLSHEASTVSRRRLTDSQSSPSITSSIDDARWPGTLDGKP